MDALALEPPPRPELHRSAGSSAAPAVLSSAELAECTCPDWCERDHDRD